MNTIVHITSRDAWQAAQHAGRCEAASLHSEGFIHCSTREQVVAVANRLFKGREDLLLLRIDADRVTHEIRRENLSGGEDLYPHIYGPINLDAVIDVLPFACEADGTFELPAALRDAANI